MGEITQRKSQYRKDRQKQSLGVLQHLEEKKVRSHQKRLGGKADKEGGGKKQESVPKKKARKRVS